jgi:hypothetical protein
MKVVKVLFISRLWSRDDHFKDIILTYNSSFAAKAIKKSHKSSVYMDVDGGSCNKLPKVILHREHHFRSHNHMLHDKSI